ncbi:MAG: DUF99 family protein [Candidatus Bathyarchaeota archaeon]|nr:MAG: DUF99 family protein [Candidatus Bathyarchaeota archaeon]
MRSYVIRQVKEEIRVLGVAAKKDEDSKGYHIVGAVFRGRLYLDGVMATGARGADVTEETVEMITASPHHLQIRVILIYAGLLDGSTIDPIALSEATSRPIIAIGHAQEATNGVSTEKFHLVVDDTVIPVLSVGLKERVARQVLGKATRNAVLPEALRVAGLIVSG